MTCSIEKDCDNCDGLCRDQPHIWNQKCSGRRTGNNCAVDMLTGRPRPMQGVPLQRPKEYDVSTVQLQSSPCCGIQAYRTIEAHGLAGCLGTWGRNTTRSCRRVQQSRETSDLTLSMCVFLNKENEQSIDGKKVLFAATEDRLRSCRPEQAFEVDNKTSPLRGSTQ